MSSAPRGASAAVVLGGTLSVPRIGFGAMHLPGRWGGPVRPPEEAIAVARRAVGLGALHIDTAAFYFAGDVRANDLLRRALHPYADGVSIATKVGPIRNRDGEMIGEAEPGQLRAAVRQNLTDLDLDVLDLVYLRVGRLSGSAAAPLGDRFAALAELREEGLIRHLGVSNVTGPQLAEARAIAPVAAVQNRYSVLDRADDALVGTCAAAGIAFMPFFALGGAGGSLASDALGKVAERHGATVRQIALAWGLARSPSIVQIPGTASLAHLEENMAAADIALTDEDMAMLAA
ncbi:oxidoreductase [Streptomyces sp. 8L]|uniref:oxidoreductase n=1 Tax=Streptomyces sp. 8L TaxID=2877242 RepID=UPI001CD62846|nr:oxidoreductase [Streptomyces sp. 8L]MCA1217460.1 oxidoreductase [Streptomyces sp. 8L]